MRMLAAHDAEGNIYQVVVSPPDAPPATAATQPGLLITEVVVPETIRGLDLSDPEQAAQQLSRFVQEFRVEPGTKARLIPKEPKGP